MTNTKEKIKTISIYLSTSLSFISKFFSILKKKDLEAVLKFLDSLPHFLLLIGGLLD